MQTCSGSVYAPVEESELEEKTFDVLRSTGNVYSERRAAGNESFLKILELSNPWKKRVKGWNVVSITSIASSKRIPINQNSSDSPSKVSLGRLPHQSSAGPFGLRRNLSAYYLTPAPQKSRSSIVIFSRRHRHFPKRSRREGTIACVYLSALSSADDKASEARRHRARCSRLQRLSYRRGPRN